MKTGELTDAIGSIDFRFVEEAEKWEGTYRRPRRFKALLPLAACLCLAAAGGVYGLWDYAAGTGTGESAGGAESAAEADGAGASGSGGFSEETDGADVLAGASGRAEETDGAGIDGAEAGQPEENAGDTAGGGTQIRVNEVEELSCTIYDGNAPERVEQFEAEELAGYYGTVVVPDRLPEGLALENASEAPYKVAYDAEDRVMDDNNTLSFSDESGSRKLEISVRTVEQAGEVVSFKDSGLRTSLVQGKKVTIGHYRETDGDDGYLAIFEAGGVIFTVRGRNLSEAEFVLVLSGLT